MLHPADEPRPLRTWRARWVPCGASATPSSDAGSLYVSVGSRRSRGHAQGRAWTILAAARGGEAPFELDGAVDAQHLRERVGDLELSPGLDERVVDDLRQHLLVA